MSARNLDGYGRFRSKTVAFRVTPEENAMIDTFARLSGKTKQDYITDRLLCKDVVVQGNPRVYKALKEQLTAVHEELQRVGRCSDVTPEFLEELHFMGTILGGMKEEYRRNDADCLDS